MIITAFLLGFVIGVCVAVLGVLLAINDLYEEIWST